MNSRSLPSHYPDKWKCENKAEVALNWTFKTIKLLKESMKKSSFSKIREFLSTHHHLLIVYLRYSSLVNSVVNLCRNAIASLCSLTTRRNMSLWTSIGPKHSAHYYRLKATKVFCSSSKITRLSYTKPRANTEKGTVSAASWLWITCPLTPTTIA